MKILIVATQISTVNAFLIPHIEMLVQNGYSVDVAANINSEINSKVVKLCDNIYNVKFARSPLSIKNAKSYLQIREILRKEYHVIHVHTPVASFVTRLAFKKSMKTKMIYTAHGFHFFKGAPLINWILFFPIEWIVSKKTDVLVTINNEDFIFANNYLKIKKIIHVNGVGINLKFFREEYENCDRNLIRNSLKIGSDAIVLTYVAELNGNKNQQLLLETLKELNEKKRQYQLVLVGEGVNKSKYIEIAEKLGIAKKVHLLGKRSDIPGILKATDIYVASSKREGLPVNVMEAMSVGLPIVATDNRGHRELIHDNQNGFLVEGFDSKEFAEKIEELHNLRLFEQFNKKSLEIIEEYNVSKIVREMGAIYEQ